MRAATRVLVVDDEEHARSALRELLCDEGYDVETVGDGVAAYEQLAAFHPDVVLSDLEMPRMSGVQLADLMRDHPDRPALILMSSRRPPPGTTAPFVAKPIAIGELLRTIECAVADHARRK
jgi:two-component system response regulator MprA